MDLGGAISNLLSLGAKLLPTAQAPSSSSSSVVVQSPQIEAELEKLMRMLERIKVTLYDAEQREITDLAVKLWLMELKGVAHVAEDVLGEYHYEVLRAQVEARDTSLPDSRKRKLIQVPSSMLDQIQHIRRIFDEIANDRMALQLSKGDRPMRCDNKLQIAHTSSLVVQSDIIGRESEKEKLIDLLSSECGVVSVVTIVGMGGIGKTTLAQLAYNDQRIRQRFDKFGWICVSEDFNVERLTKKLVECITGNECSLSNLNVLQEKISKEISGKRILLVLDDVWHENRSLWEKFQVPFKLAAFVKILVTTRNNHVAQIMQTVPTFYLGYLSTEQCWQLFEHYAFGGVELKKDPKLVDIGKQILNKCGLLPLAVKSIASLLRLEEKEESWRDILENELWESTDVSNEIFPSLQISYARLPIHLKPCFLYCSMFPKDYEYNVGDMVKYWMSQGFIASKGNKTAKKIGSEYAEALCQRSLFERESGHVGNMVKFKLHDIVHDLARLNSENRCYSIHVGKVPIFPNVLYHLYIVDSVNLIDSIPSDKFTALRTLIVYCSVETFLSFDLSLAPKLRALEISFDLHSFQSIPEQARMSVSKKFCDFFNAVGNLKYLRYLSLDTNPYPLPECICSLYSLQYLTLRDYICKELPTKIGNLISLEELIIHGYNTLEVDVLPESLCQLKALRKLSISRCRLQVLPSDIGSLTNLQTLKLCIDGLSYLPPSLSKFVGIQSLRVSLECEAIGWLKDFPDLGGALCLRGLENIFNLMDVHCANLVRMRNLKELILDWRTDIYRNKESSVFELTIKWGQNRIREHFREHFSVLASLQPHPNLRRLEICDYSGNTFPEWIGNLCKLEYLCIRYCYSLQFLKAELLPLALKELEIDFCEELVSISGMQKLKSLVKVSIRYCGKLCSFLGPSLELSMSTWEGSHESSSKLTNFADEWHPVEPCKVEVIDCGGLKQWCLQHGIEYQDYYDDKEKGYADEYEGGEEEQEEVREPRKPTKEKKDFRSGLVELEGKNRLKESAERQTSTLKTVLQECPVRRPCGQPRLRLSGVSASSTPGAIMRSPRDLGSAELPSRSSSSPLPQSLPLLDVAGLGENPSFLASPQRELGLSKNSIIGRENEKNSIIGFLLSEDFNRNNLTVVCMVGESGIGKTSLAHLIYSEERIFDSFDARMFITMPEKSDETRLIKKLFESVTSSPCPMTEADLLEELLIDELSGTKVFVVLDDADNENPFFWDRIVTILNHSTRGSILLVTTKSKDVAEVMGAMQTYRLDPLSDDYCWKLFWQHIFTGLNTNANTDLVETGNRLVSKCQHNPLCIKVVAGLLVCLKNVESWVEILKTDLLNMDGFDGDTLPILRVCYETLPDNLKKCLHYCSLFPKDYAFTKQQIVRMWMSQGFIVSVEQRQPEEVGLQNFDELLLRGFFQHSPLHDVEEDKYIMHDLIRALATHFSRNESASAEDAVEGILENCFHFSLNPSVIQIDKMKPLIKEASDLQSFLVLSRLQTRINISILDITSLSDLFTKCINLRTLDLSCTDIVELPSSVGMLKQLRYLGVNNTKIRSIPRELCRLVSLQTLEAKDCQHLVELPESMMELTNLRHLDVSKKSGCVKMMIGIGQLTNLQSLAVFCVGCEMPYCSIRELKDLNCLSSCLQIAGLENITYGLDAKEAALHNKVHLNTLWLHWNDNRTCIESEESVTISEEVLKNLKPNPNIGELIIRNYRGNLFPTWMGDPSFSKLVSIILDKCLNCSQFPALGGLPSLRHLSVQKLYHLVRLENTDSQFVSKNTPKFPSLETLNLWEMYDLEELFETSDCDFPCLHTLSISRCPMLKSVPCFSSLLNLSLYCCVKLPYLPDFPLLKSLRIDGFKKIISLELPKDLPALKELEIRHCNELLLVEGLPKLPSLEKLNVVHCPKFDPFKSWKPCHSKSISTTRRFFPKEESTTQVEHEETSNFAEMLIADNPDSLFAPEVINPSRMSCLSDLSNTNESMVGHSVSKREREPSDEDTNDKQPKVDKLKRRHRDNGERVMQWVPAVRTGNSEMPPDDGYTWRKYGQKDILGCRFPRSYFRCTHKNYYGCEAKKQVQRLDEDPYTYEIVYCGQHSCLTSTTPLLISSLAPTNTVVTSAVAPITIPTINTSNVTTNPHIESSMIGTTVAQMQPSTSIHLGNWLTKDLGDGRPVADMADVLFNSGSSSSSMDAIFSSQHEN